MARESRDETIIKWIIVVGFALTGVVSVVVLDVILPKGPFATMTCVDVPCGCGR